MIFKPYMILLVCIICIAGVIGCTDATRSKLASYGDEHTIRVLSGGKVIQTYVSTGKVNSIDGSDGWEFRDKATDKFIRVSGDVIISVN
jgi:hypothetical protein